MLAAARGTSPSSGTSSWQLMAPTIDCYEPEERLHRADTAAAATGSFLITHEDVWMLARPDGVCEAMPSPQPAAIHGPPTTSPVPMLFINGAADPKDPPANVAEARRVYPNSLAVTVPDQAHDYHVDPSCRVGVFAAFIDKAGTAELPTQCLLEQPAPAFDLG